VDITSPGLIGGTAGAIDDATLEADPEAKRVVRRISSLIDPIGIALGLAWFVEPVDGARKFRGDDVEDTVESSVAQFLKVEGY